MDTERDDGAAVEPASSPLAEPLHRLQLLAQARRAAEDARDLLESQLGSPYRDRTLIVEAVRGTLSVFLLPMRCFVLREEAGTILLFRPGNWTLYIRMLAYNGIALAEADRREAFAPVADDAIEYDWLERLGYAKKETA